MFLFAQLKKEALTQVFRIEYCKIFKNVILTEQLQVTASVKTKVIK